MPESRDSFDVVIIGAGPAGGAAAMALAHAPIRFAVLERGSWPRHKPCGGALPFPARSVLPIDWDSIWSDEITRVVSRYQGRDERIAAMAAPAVLMVNRHEFDAAIIEAAQRSAQGRMQFEPRSHVRSLTRSATGRYDIALANGASYQAAHVILATGSHSRLARSTGLASPARPALAIECEVEVSAQCHERAARQLTFDHGCATGGYAWIFPKQAPWLSCGIGGRGKPRELKTRLGALLNQHLGAKHIKRIVTRGHPLSAFHARAPVGRHGLLLVGDAANLIDPISGEGIWYALRSGQLAGEALAKHYDSRQDCDLAGAGPMVHDIGVDATGVDDTGVVAAYNAAVAAELFPPLDACARLALPDLMEAPEFFYRRFLASGHNYQQFYLALMNAAQGKHDGA